MFHVEHSGSIVRFLVIWHAGWSRLGVAALGAGLRSLTLRLAVV
jgi:hypothetical protein